MSEKYNKQKKIVFILFVISVFYFVLFIVPNTVGSEDIKMVAIFEPDEAVPFPALLDMIKPANNVKEALINFAFYDYYFYGYPVFGVSGLLLLPIKWMGQLSNMTLVMGVLRQVVSVLPMLISIWLLVYMRTKFTSYYAIFLFVLLITLPAVVQNNFWWHPDSLAILFAVLVLFFMERDQFSFGKNFHIAAIFCGFSAGTKGIGFYFFLTIFLYLLVGLFGKKIKLNKIIIAAIAFIVFMGIGYLIANPILIYESVRTRYFSVMQEQSKLIFYGYEIFYEKGLATALPEIRHYYGFLSFVLIGIGANIYGIFVGKKRLLDGLIFFWFVPLTVMVFFISHFKYQYWLPAMLPVLSSLVEIFPEKGDLHQIKVGLSQGKFRPAWIKIILSILIVMQLIQFILADITKVQKRIVRAENHPAITFYEKTQAMITPYVEDSLYVYHDVRMYVPQREDWYAEAEFNMLNYDYIHQKGFDVLYLMQQRLYDYLNPNALALDINELDLAREFYRDANNGTIEGYELLYRNDYGLVFIKKALIK